VTQSDRFERMLKWFPPAWRARYGEGLRALLEDSYGDGRIPWRARASFARSGLGERVRESGLAGDVSGASQQLRAGSLLILCGWSAFMAAGAIFAKVSEHWSYSTPVVSRAVPVVGYGIVTWAGAIGVALVAVGALAALPSLIALLRRGGWPSIRRPTQRAVITCAVVAVLTGALAGWAHFLSPQDRNGGLVAYEVAFLVWSTVVIVALAVGTGSVVAVVARLDIPLKRVRALSMAALALALVMVAVLGGVVVWWVSESSAAPSFLRDNIGSGIVPLFRTFSPTMVVAVTFMVLGLAVALKGVARVTRTLRSADVTPGAAA